MADRLTQLQDCLDELLSQMFHAVKYIQDRAPYATIPGQPDQSGPGETASGEKDATLPSGENQMRSQQQSAHQNTVSSPTPHGAQEFNAKLREMAQDLVLREQQIEYIIQSLPGIGSSEADQGRRMRELEAELRVAEDGRARAEIVREQLENDLGKIIMEARRVEYVDDRVSSKLS